MKLEKVREEVYYFSQKASEANQKLAIAGVALIWLFKVSTTGGIQLAGLLFVALVLFIVSLAIELLHYSVLAPIWGNYYDKEYKRIKSDPNHQGDIEQTEVSQPKKGNALGWFLFYLKLACSVVGYVVFFWYMLQNIETV